MGQRLAKQLGREAGIQRFRAQLRHRRVPQPQMPELARVLQHHALLANAEDHRGMSRQRSMARQHLPSAGHAQMSHQQLRLPAGAHTIPQEALPPAAEVLDTHSLQCLPERPDRHGTHQPRLEHRNRIDALATNPWQQPPSKRLHFGQLRHGENLSHPDGGTNGEARPRANTTGSGRLDSVGFGPWFRRSSSSCPCSMRSPTSFRW